MGAVVSLDRAELAALNVAEVADIVSQSWISEHRQACIDFGIDGDMLTRLPLDQLVDALRRAGVERDDHLDFLLEELEKIRFPKIDCSKLDREHLREILQESATHPYHWDSDSEVSDWTGVFVDVNDRITGLNLANGNLSGELPDTLGKIACLEYLHATSNSLTGNIPEAIGDLTRLTSLRLNHNRLDGRLPISLTRLTNLTDLHLGWNILTATIPMKMSYMTALQKLNMSANKFNGAIPKEIGTLRFLVELRLRENKLGGKIPPLLGNMSSLQALDLTSNLLQGHIPGSLGGMTSLRELWLGGNHLVGGIPETISKLKALHSLDLSCNKFAAILPQRLFPALSSSLVYLNLSHNAFEGDLPLASLLPRSREITPKDLDPDSDDDSSTREWPTEMDYSPLSYVNLSHNQLTGSIPEDIGALTSLDTLDLSKNKLQGPLPPGIGECVSLRILSLSRCGLSGRLDEPQGDGAGGDRGLDQLTLLESLRLDNNMFEGSVPWSFGKLTRLEALYLQGNCFSGHLPWKFGQLDRLWALVLRDNELSGRVPEAFRRLGKLRSLRLEGNSSLQGPIPAILASRPGCKVTADEGLLEDTEASMLGARLDDWFLVPRKIFMGLKEFPGYGAVRSSLLHYVSTVAPHECYVFAEARGRRLVVKRKEIVFFSHCWELLPDKCPPSSDFLEGPHPDTPNHDKLLHMKSCLEGAPSSIQYVWVDMLCVQLAESTRRRAAGRSVPFFVQNSGRFYIMASDMNGLQRYRSRAWCRLEALCAVCPYQPSQAVSIFSPNKPAYSSTKGKFVYDSVECFVSTWDNGSRAEAQLNGAELEVSGFLGDPVLGKLSDINDRPDVAESALAAVNEMELSGRMEPGIAKPLRFSCKKVIFGSQGWEGDSDDEQEALSRESDKPKREGAGLFSRARRVAVPSSSPAATATNNT